MDKTREELEQLKAKLVNELDEVNKALAASGNTEGVIGYFFHDLDDLSFVRRSDSSWIKERMKPTIEEAARDIALYNLGCIKNSFEECVLDAMRLEHFIKERLGGIIDAQDKDGLKELRDLLNYTHVHYNDDILSKFRTWVEWFNESYELP